MQLNSFDDIDYVAKNYPDTRFYVGKCIGCLTYYLGERSHGKYCSDSCRVKAWRLNRDVKVVVRMCKDARISAD